METLSHLPTFKKPPLQEVTLGIQFAQVPGFLSIHGGGIWELFRDTHPNPQEQPRLSPQFETFGGVPLESGPQIQFGMQHQGNRLWFISDDQNDVIQFQSDRFLKNWRKAQNSNDYPRYLNLSSQFKTDIENLSQHLKSKFQYDLSINQVEITYRNIIPVNDFSDGDSWFNFFPKSEMNLESFAKNFSEVLNDGNGKPIARLHYNFHSVINRSDGSKAFNFTITFRGKPTANLDGNLMEFLELGHRSIVSRFTGLTTDAAHKYWEISDV